MISEPPVLQYYNLEEDVTLETDASDYGLGAVLLQKGRPVAFASRTLSQSERRYPQIEKECLSLVFGCISAPKRKYCVNKTINCWRQF